MRALPENVRQLILSGRYSLGISARIGNSAGVMSDLTGFDGEELMLSASWDTNIDTQVQQMNLTILGQGRRFSVRNLITDTPVNASEAKIDLNRQLQVTLNLYPNNSDRSVASLNIFEGYISEFDDAGDINIVALDPLGKLAEQFIETEQSYGSDQGVDIQEIIKQILRNNNQGALADNMLVVGNPGYAIKPYLQKKEPVLTAIQNLVQLIGWDVRMRWIDVSQQWRMTLYEPDRTSSVVAMTFGPDNYTDVTKLTRTSAGIRNFVRVIYGAAESRGTYETKDDASIFKYGRKFMELSEASDSTINTAAEAKRYADAALADLKEPYSEQEISMMLFPYAELQDKYLFKANGVHYDRDYTWAVVGVRHSVDSGSGSTSLSLRGKPAAAYKQWLKLEVRPGLNDGVSTTAPRAPTTPIVTPLYKALQVAFEPVTGVVEYRIHMSTSPNFVASSANIVARGSSTLYTLGNLDTNVTYYIKLTAIDAQGNLSQASAAGIGKPTDLPKDITPPSAPSLISISTSLERNGKISTALIRAQWSSNAEADLAGYVLRYRQLGRSDWTNTFSVDTVQTISGLPGSTLYQFAVAAQDSSGNLSNFVQWSDIKTAATNVPTDISNLTADFSTRNFSAIWDANTDSDFDFYEIDIIQGRGTDYVAQHNIKTVDARYNYTFAQNSIDGGGTAYGAIRIYVRAVNTQGVRGNYATVARQNSAPNVPSITEISSGLSTVQVSRDTIVPEDYRTTEYQIADNAAFSSAYSSITSQERGNYLPIKGIGKNYVRARNFDLFGQSSAWSQTAQVDAILINSAVMQGAIFDIVPSVPTTTFTGDLRTLWDTDINSGVTLNAAGHIQFMFPVTQLIDMVRVWIDRPATLAVDTLKDDGTWDNVGKVRGATSNFSVQGVAGWNIIKLPFKWGSKGWRLYIDRAAIVNELKFSSVILGDEIIGQNITATGSMQIRSQNNSVIIDQNGITISGAPGANTNDTAAAQNNAQQYAVAQDQPIIALAQFARDELNRMADDNVLTPSEKVMVKNRLLEIDKATSTVNRDKGNLGGVLNDIGSQVVARANEIHQILDPVLTNMGVSSSVDGQYLRTKLGDWSDYYTYFLMNASGQAQTNSQAYAVAQDQPIIAAAAAATQKLNDLASDNVLTPSEKIVIKSRLGELDTATSIANRDKAQLGGELITIATELTRRLGLIHTLIDPALADLTVNSTIDGNDLRSRINSWNDTYTYFLMHTGTEARSQANAVTGVLAGITYRLTARGANTPVNFANALYPAGLSRLNSDGTYTSMSGENRSWTVFKKNRLTGAEEITTYDVYGSYSRGVDLTNYLNGLGSDWIVAIYTFDEPQNSATSNAALVAALVRCGGTNLNLKKLKFRGAYLLVGIPGIGEGQGLEMMKGSIDNDTVAFCDTTFTIRGGAVELPGGSIISDARDVNYSSGQTIDSLKPAQPGADITSANYAKDQHNFNNMGGYAAGNQVRLSSAGVEVYPTAAGGSKRTALLDGSGLVISDISSNKRVKTGNLSGLPWGTETLGDVYGLWGDVSGIYLRGYPVILAVGQVDVTTPADYQYTGKTFAVQGATVTVPLPARHLAAGRSLTIVSSVIAQKTTNTLNGGPSEAASGSIQTRDGLPPEYFLTLQRWVLDADANKQKVVTPGAIELTTAKFAVYMSGTSTQASNSKTTFNYTGTVQYMIFETETAGS